MKLKNASILLLFISLAACAPHASEPQGERDATTAKQETEIDRPPLVYKLFYDRDDSTFWRIKPGFLREDGAASLEYKDSRSLANKAGAAEPVLPGEVFFKDGPAQGRFRYLGHEVRKEMNSAINVVETLSYVRIEDLQPNKAGTIYEFPAPLKNADMHQYIQHDRSAVLSLRALGESLNLMFIQENTRFSLPFGQAEEPYLLKSVSPDAIVVEWMEKGETRQLKIQRGLLPQWPPAG